MDCIKILKKIEQLKNNIDAASGPRTIIMFLVVCLIFGGIFTTIALQLDLLAVNTDVAAIPGATAMISIVGLMGVIILVMWAIKRAF